MTAHEGGNTPPPLFFGSLDLLSEPDRAYMLNALTHERSLAEGRRDWLRGVLGVTSQGAIDDTRRQFATLRTSNISAIVENTDAISRAANHPLLAERQLRIGMFFAGHHNDKLGETFGMNPSEVRAERQDIVNYVNGESGYSVSEIMRQHIAEARKKAIGQLLGSATLHLLYGDSIHRPVKFTSEQTPIFTTREFEVYEAAVIVEEVEKKMISHGELVPHLSLLQKHFLDTEHEMIPPLRNEVSRSLKILSAITRNAILKATLMGEPVTRSKKLDTSLTFLQQFIDHKGGVVPPSRATYMKRLKSTMHLGDEQGLDEVHRKANEAYLQAKIEEDNQKLARALSWLFNEERIADYRNSNAK